MPRSLNTSDQRRRRPATAQCQPLEPRRLLAAIFDPTFGGGDGFTLMPAPFAYRSAEGMTNPLVPEFISRLSDAYFTFGSQLVQDTGNSTIDSRAFHALVEDDGAVSTKLGRDSDGDGFVFYSRTGDPGEQFGAGDYVDMVALSDGSALALQRPPGSPTDSAVVKVRPDGRESSFFRIEDIGVIHAIELLTPQIGVLLAQVEAVGAAAPIGPEDSVYAVYTFDTSSGALSEPVLPFGDWLRLDRIASTPTLHAGRDSNLYLGTLTSDLDGADGNPDDSGFILTRLNLVGDTLKRDGAFGASQQLPGQKTSAFYRPSNLPIDSTVHSFLVAGTTSQGRVWLKMPDPVSGQQATAFALLTSAGALDPTFGQNGVVEVTFPGGDAGLANLADESPGFRGARTGLTGAPAPLVRGDGSLVGLISLAQGTAFPSGTGFALGIYGLLPDGSLDPRIAEADSPFGLGRALIATDVDADSDIETASVQAALYLDDADRVVISTAVLSDATSPIQSLMVGRILLGTPRTEVVERPNGDQVFEIEGTTGDDRFILRSGAGGTVQLLQHPVGALASVMGEFSSDGLDFIELMGGEGDDVLFSQVNAFAGLVTVFGGNGNDTLSANGRFDRIFGEVGDDSLLGGLGDQLMFGAEGNDTLKGGSGRDALFGEAGNDQLFGLTDDDLLEGGLGRDTLDGGDGADTLVSGAGSDVLIGGNGERDLLWLRDDTGAPDLGVGSNVDLTAGAAEISGVADELASVEHVLGTDGDDLIRGNNARNAFYGGLGSDTLLGMGGKDTLIGGFGSDTLDGGDDSDLLLDWAGLLGDANPDVLIGGGGFDRALLDAFDEVEVESVFETLEELLEVL